MLMKYATNIFMKISEDPEGEYILGIVQIFSGIFQMYVCAYSLCILRILRGFSSRIFLEGYITNIPHVVGYSPHIRDQNRIFLTT